MMTATVEARVNVWESVNLCLSSGLPTPINAVSFNNKEFGLVEEVTLSVTTNGNSSMVLVESLRGCCKNELP